MRNINFVQNNSIQVNRTSIASLGRKISMLEAGGSSNCSLVRIEFTCERNTCDVKAFGSGSIIHFRKNIHF
jgi:hypothetical protein